ncbi:MAG TPA: ABC transporter substrate-binding protein, partial [Hyphomicrobiaceae bacterium]|nr:ABC transporter substrate-binding protein [Hyphomicrobiaceae bacterium]
MKRREILKSGLVVAAGSTVGSILAAPAIAQSAPSIRWRLTSSFPKS